MAPCVLVWIVFFGRFFLSGNRPLPIIRHQVTLPSAGLYISRGMEWSYGDRQIERGWSRLGSFTTNKNHSFGSCVGVACSIGCLVGSPSCHDVSMFLRWFLLECTCSFPGWKILRFQPLPHDSIPEICFICHNLTGFSKHNFIGLFTGVCKSLHSFHTAELVPGIAAHLKATLQLLQLRSMESLGAVRNK